MNLTILHGHCIDRLRELEPNSVDCVVTSPPYWGLRDYGIEPVLWDCVRFRPAAGLDYMVLPSEICCLGLERNPWAFVGHMVQVFREVMRVLRPAGTCWVNLGDSYCGKPGGAQGKTGQRASRTFTAWIDLNKISPGLKAKDLVGVPWRCAQALQADGWYLRRDIIWSKPNPMPETVYDRPTTAHEYIFLLTKSPKYYYDFEAIQEPVSGTAHARGNGVNRKIKMPDGWDTGKGAHGAFHRDGREKGKIREKQNKSFSAAVSGLVETRNKRSVWTVPSSPFSDAHFATYPPNLIRPCIRAGCPRGGIVLDPFGGSGTTGQVAIEEGRKAVLIEANEAYLPMIHRRTNITPGFGI